MTFPLWNPLPTGVVLSELVGASLLLLPTSPGVRAVVASVQFPTEGGYPVSFAWVDALDARGVLTLPDGDAHDRLTRLKIGGSFDVIVIPPIAWRTQGERLRRLNAIAAGRYKLVNVCGVRCDARLARTGDGSGPGGHP